MPLGRRNYSATAKWLHWLIVILVLTQFLVAALMPDIGPRAVPGTLVNLHLALGVFILAFTALRFVNRLFDPVPLDAHDSPAWERLAARATHWAFYFILLVGPSWAGHRRRPTAFPSPCSPAA